MSLLNNLSSISTSYYFYGAGANFPSNPKNGGIFFNTTDNIQYLYYTTSSCTGNWMPIGDISNYNKNTEFSKIKEMKCESCGAPLKIRSKYDIKCEYCGKVYIGE